jgi:gamma-glutamylputrescine oxidase
LLKQDSLFLGLGKDGGHAVEEERECRESVGFTDQRVYDESQLKGVLGAQDYTAGIRYGGTYGINPLATLQGFKNLLVDNGMEIYESTEMERLEDHTVCTHAAHHGGQDHHCGGQADDHQSTFERGLSLQTFLA